MKKKKKGRPYIVSVANELLTSDPKTSSQSSPRACVCCPPRYRLKLETPFFTT